MIISRYLIKEALSTLVAVIFVLLLVFLSQQLVRYLGYAASGKIAANILFQVVAFEIPNLLALLLPLSLFLGIVLTYSRLYVDNELRVLHACGLSTQRLIGITCSLALFIALILMGLMLWVNPHIAADKQKTLASGSADNLLNTLMPGRFQVSSDGRRVVYVERMSRNHKKASNLFIAEQGIDTAGDNSAPWTVLSAANGYQTIERGTAQPLVVAEKGYRYEGVPGQNDYKIIQFEKYAVQIPDIRLNTNRQIEEAIPTSKLLAHYNKDLESVSELQWRLSIPLSALLLALLAIPLSRVPPRQGRYTMLLPAILIYVLYMNLLFLGRNLLEQKIFPLAWGLWWVHVSIFMLVVGLMFMRRMRVL